MTGPIHLSAGWLLLIPLIVLIAWFVGLFAWFSWSLRKHRREAEEEPWPRRDEGGAYLWEDGRVTKDKDGMGVVGWWKAPDPGAPQ